MKNVGIVREVDKLGRVVIPVEFRNALGIDSESPVEISSTNDRIIIKKHLERCVFCGNEGGLFMFHEVPVCVNCINEMKNFEV